MARQKSVKYSISKNHIGSVKFILAAIFTCISHFSSAQDISYKEWQKEAKENIRLLPKYGNKPKTRAQLDADKQLIESYIKQEGSRQKASDMLIEAGFQYLQEGEVKTAMYRFNQAWLLNPDNEDVYWGWGAIYSSFSDLAKALEQYDEGLKKNPKNPKLLTDKATIFIRKYDNTGDPATLSAAISLFLKSYAADSLNPNTLFKLSTAYFRANDCVQARRFYELRKKTGSYPVPQEYTEALARTCGSGRTK
ncbi:tetratricopeptide repeat protein [Dyadobacter sandarakinus]|uniref:Tetratricopeptide repeat protein n=1 Tax=Dyadobacter sandarakinus TaxID=2747268 RepID=A0ABX7I3V3_9BACT|nr:hypothetical protein [Dyadobacter sandarakinus]QRR00744.1 hypothetical protein HWI92_07415 [Dyadobacter sandarakinus]